MQSRSDWDFHQIQKYWKWDKIEGDIISSNENLITGQRQKGLTQENESQQAPRLNFAEFDFTAGVISLTYKESQSGSANVKNWDVVTTSHIVV